MNNYLKRLLVAGWLLAAACMEERDGGETMNGSSGNGWGSLNEGKDSGTEAQCEPQAGYLDAAARIELLEIGTQQYRGRAVIAAEEAVGSSMRVRFDPKSGPICLRGTDYNAFYRDRGVDKTLIVLDGGGACWTGLCPAEPNADTEPYARSVASETPDNPFRDWNLVFAPYCDGSIFWGDNEVLEADGGMRYQHGRQNLAAALDLAEQHFGDSKQVMLFGFSAGGFGTIPASLQVRLRFPEADLFVVDDSGPGVHNPDQPDVLERQLDEWKFAQTIPPSCTECDAGRAQFSELVRWFLVRDTNTRLSILSYYEDSVIGQRFNALDGPAYKALILNETTKLHDAFPERVQRYMLSGTKHVLTYELATLSVEGVALADWMNAMVTNDTKTWRDLLGP
jgi:hypothetical protein